MGSDHLNNSSLVLAEGALGDGKLDSDIQPKFTRQRLMTYKQISKFTPTLFLTRTDAVVVEESESTIPLKSPHGAALFEPETGRGLEDAVWKMVHVQLQVPQN